MKIKIKNLVTKLILIWVFTLWSWTLKYIFLATGGKWGKRKIIPLNTNGMAIQVQLINKNSSNNQWLNVKHEYFTQLVITTLRTVFFVFNNLNSLIVFDKKVKGGTRNYTWLSVITIHVLLIPSANIIFKALAEQSPQEYKTNSYVWKIKLVISFLWRKCAIFK